MPPKQLRPRCQAGSGEIVAIEGMFVNFRGPRFTEARPTAVQSPVYKVIRLAFAQTAGASSHEGSALV